MDVTDALKRPWFHSIDLGSGIVTRGRFGADVPPNYTLYGVQDLLRHVDLSEARCFDVGTMDGLSAFMMKALGAREVVACDLADRPNFAFARERLGLDVEHRVPVSARDLPRAVGGEGADVIVIAGVLYHVYDPLTVLLACRHALRRGGLLFLETTCMIDDGRPTMWFNMSNDVPFQIPLPNVYWRTSKSALLGMLRFSGFEPLATRTVDARVTVVAEARRPADISERGGLVARAQNQYRAGHYEVADFAALDDGEGPTAKVRYAGPLDDRFLYRGLYEPEVPLQPRWEPPSRATRLADVAKSAALHAAMRLGERRASLRQGLGRGLSRALGGADP